MAQRSSSQVVIVGCGIAGPALGMFLRRIGVEVVVCERRPSEPVDEGLFLGVAPNGMNVLAELDLHRAVEAISVPCRGFEFHNARGQVIGTIDRAGEGVCRIRARPANTRRDDCQAVAAEW